ncbi:MAG: hypothetical protein V4739_04655 [Pseudomonadota bacterium]
MKHATATPEQIYDERIAPKLLALATECEAAGFSLVATCEWQPGESGETAFINKDASFAIRLVHTAIKAHGNVDTLMFALMKHARKHGHRSLILSQLGIPPEPKLGDEVEL